MAMSKKDYIRVAGILSKLEGDLPIMSQEIIFTAILEFANMFEEDNPNFDREKFVDACYE